MQLLLESNGIMEFVDGFNHCLPLHISQFGDSGINSLDSYTYAENDDLHCTIS